MSEIPPIFDLNNKPNTITRPDELRKQPSVTPAKEVINPTLKSTFSYGDKIPNPEGSSLLYLTNYRLFQQDTPTNIKQRISTTKMKMRGKLFKIRYSPPRFCGLYKSVRMKVTGNQLLEVIFSKIPCNSWCCPVCSVRKAIRLKYRLRDIILLNNLEYFITLTLDPKKIPVSYQYDTHKYITKLFNHFLTVLRRKKYKYFNERSNRYFFFDLTKSKDKLKYVWVIEFQKSTHNAHMHILINQYLPIYVIRKIWRHVGGGVQMKIKKVKSPKGISNYITDYIVKGIKDTSSNVSQGYGFKYFERRYSVSKSCIKPDINHKDNAYALNEEELMRQNLGWIVKELYNADTDYFKIKFDNNFPAPKDI